MSNNEKPSIEQRIRDLKSKLYSHESEIGDWKIAKCNEYNMVGEKPPYDVEELHRQRQEVRDEINKLEEELEKAENGKDE